MEERRWEDMETDCLIDIFKRLALDDLTFGVPFVCRSWLSASSDPLCWTVLDFRPLDFLPWSQFSRRFTAAFSLLRFSFAGFMKVVVGRGKGSAVELRFPPVYGALAEDLVYASNECPRLRIVSIPRLADKDEEHHPEIVGKWKDLESLEMELKPSSFGEIVNKISISCSKFAALKMCGSIKKEDASGIVEFLPMLKHLDLSRSFLPKDVLLVIVEGCKELQSLRVTDCVGFDACDEEIMRRAASIEIFEHQGSKLIDDFDYQTDE